MEPVGVRLFCKLCFCGRMSLDLVVGGGEGSCCQAWRGSGHLCPMQVVSVWSIPAPHPAHSLSFPSPGADVKEPEITTQGALAAVCGHVSVWDTLSSPGISHPIASTKRAAVAQGTGKGQQNSEEEGPCVGS